MKTILATLLIAALAACTPVKNRSETGEPRSAIENRARIHTDLGAAYYELEDFARALKSYVKALELVPGYLGAMVNAGHSLRMLGRYDEAMRMGQQVLARAADDGDALFLIGASSFARGDYAKAKSHLERFLQTNPEIEVATEVEGMLEVIRGKLADLN